MIDFYWGARPKKTVARIDIADLDDLDAIIYSNDT